MNAHVDMGKPIVEHLHIRSDPPSHLIEFAMASLQRAVFEGQFALMTPDKSKQFCGDVVFVSADAIGDAALVLLNGIRRKTLAPVIVVAPEITTEQRILLLSLGVDHVLPAIMDDRELTAILRNATRGSRSVESRPRAGERDHRWQLDDERWLLIAPNLREIRLTRSEYQILRVLFDTPATVIRRCALISVMNGLAGRGGSRSLDVQLSRLRHKVWECARIELPLRSERNAGYLFVGIIA